MSRINTNVSSLLGQRVLGQQNRSLNTSLERLSTGLRINRGADDPAGLIASESLRSEKASITAAISNAERAEQVVNIAEGGLQEINNLLLEVQSLVGQSANDAGLSADEKEANQLQIDSILQTIDRISETTSFQGTKLLNGTYDFNLESQATTVNEVKVNAAKIPAGETRDVKVLVTQSAQNAGFFLSTNGALDLSAADATFRFDLAGSIGSREFSFASGTALADIAATVNTFTEITGISAVASGTGVKFNSVGLGSDEFVQVDIRDDAGQAGSVLNLSSNASLTASTVGGTTFAAANNPLRDAGQDIGATINGVAATTKGASARVSSDFLDVEIDLTTAGAQALAAIDAVTITGGGANFNLGPNVDIGNQVSIGISNVASRNLGSNESGFLNQLASGQDSNVVDGDLTTAQKIVNDAVAEVSTLRGRLGAFQKNTVGATIRSLGIALENTSAAESAIRDTDFASETAELTRSQILVQAATNTLGIANSQPQNVLSLLG
ncbi:MAG: flagellin [Planctomycetota bacterium]